MNVTKFRAYLAYSFRDLARDRQTTDRQTTDAATETEGSHTVSVLQSLIIVSICCGFVVQQMEPTEFEPYNS